MDLAARHPDHVSALVLLEPPVDFRPLGGRGMLGLTAGIHLRRLVKGERAAAHWFFREVTSYQSGKPPAFDTLPPALQEICLANARAHLASFKYSPEASGRHLPRGGIRAIQADATCITGGESYRPFVRTTRKVAKRLPNARLIDVPGASHVLPYDAADATVEAVRRAVSLRGGLGDGRAGAVPPSAPAQLG